MIKPTIKTISLLAALALVLSSIATVTAAEQPIPKPDCKPADMSKPSEIEAMMAYAAITFGRVDILVNNAGIQHVARIENFPTERWDAVIAINLSSAFHATRLALPAMKAANWGRIINGKSPTAMRMGLAAFHHQADRPIQEAVPYLRDQLYALLKTEDAKEGLMAFFQKRAPVWKGR